MHKEQAYSILKIPSNKVLDIEFLKKQYRKMQKLYHPDINKSADAHELSINVKTAYEYLQKRLTIEGGNIELNILKAQSYRDVYLPNKFIIDDAFIETGEKTLNLVYNRYIKCETCKGIGATNLNTTFLFADRDDLLLRYCCGGCNGQGYIQNNFGYILCPLCGGHGLDKYRVKHICKDCKGRGVINDETKVDIVNISDIEFKKTHKCHISLKGNYNRFTNKYGVLQLTTKITTEKYKINSDYDIIVDMPNVNIVDLVLNPKNQIIIFNKTYGFNIIDINKPLRLTKIGFILSHHQKSNVLINFSVYLPKIENITTKQITELNKVKKIFTNK